METFRRTLGIKVLNGRIQLVQSIPPIENLEIEFFQCAQKVSPWIETFFCYLGEALSDDDVSVKPKMEKWANAFGKRASNCNIHPECCFISSLIMKQSQSLYRMSSLLKSSK
jgi:hypothetical protein